MYKIVDTASSILESLSDDVDAWSGTEGIVGAGSTHVGTS